MKKKSLISRLSEALSDDDGPTDEEIVRDVESSVQAIKETKVETLDGNEVFGGGWGEAGDMVYIMNLGPIYGIIGGRTGRTAVSLQETCENVFSRLAGPRRGKASFEDDRFFMRFAATTPSEGFNLAAAVVNEVGTFMLSDRFKTMEMAGLMVAADAADITNEDGSLNMEKAKAVVESGGAPLPIDAPGDGSPSWMVQLWNSMAETDQKWREIDSNMNGRMNGRKKELTARGDDRRKKKSSYFIGQERRVNSSGRRTSDSTNQMIW